MVDDDRDFIDLYSLVLSREFNVHAVTNLLGCLHFLANHPYEIDLILCDIFMPEADGFEVYDFLNSKKEFSIYPFIFKTSSLNSSVISRSLNEKKVELISTYMSNEEIIARVHRELAKESLIKIILDHKVQLVVERENGSVIFPENAYQLSFNDIELKIIKLLGSGENLINRDFLVEQVFGREYVITENNLNTIFSGLRKKMSEFGLTVKSIRGKGVQLISNHSSTCVLDD